jgi:predicted ester cyclase
MSTEENKAIVRRFFKAFEANDQAALSEVLSPRLVAYSHGEPGPQTLEVHLQGIRSWHGAFGNNRFDIEEQIAEGDTVASRMTMRSTHNGGAFMGMPPSGKQIAVAAVTIERIRDGKIVERRVTSDWLGMMQQLGLVPPPQANR